MSDEVGKIEEVNFEMVVESREVISALQTTVEEEEEIAPVVAEEGRQRDGAQESRSPRGHRSSLSSGGRARNGRSGRVTSGHFSCQT